MTGRRDRLVSQEMVLAGLSGCLADGWRGLLTGFALPIAVAAVVSRVRRIDGGRRATAALRVLWRCRPPAVRPRFGRLIRLTAGRRRWLRDPGPGPDVNERRREMSVQPRNFAVKGHQTCRFLVRSGVDTAA
jgi:hypothetical protein